MALLHVSRVSSVQLTLLPSWTGVCWLPVHAGSSIRLMTCMDRYTQDTRLNVPVFNTATLLDYYGLIHLTGIPFLYYPWLCQAFEKEFMHITGAPTFIAFMTTT